MKPVIYNKRFACSSHTMGAANLKAFFSFIFDFLNRNVTFFMRNAIFVLIEKDQHQKEQCIIFLQSCYCSYDDFYLQNYHIINTNVRTDFIITNSQIKV